MIAVLIIGLFCGCIFGYALACLMFTAKRSDDQAAKYYGGGNGGK